MIYLDYSATTKVDKDILKVFNKVCKNNYANSNSSHKIGLESNKLIENSLDEISRLLCVKPNEIIFTSGASESNNLAIKGIAFKHQNKGKHIITTKLEHSSVIATLSYLGSMGFDVQFVNLLEDGTVDINHFKSILRDDTILVSINAVDSELGIRQPIEEIGSILNSYPNCTFHTDMTQCLGKDNIDLKDVDLASFSGHKIFCFKGIGALYKKEGIEIEPLIHGGRSVTIYRSGTPQTELVVSMSKAISNALYNLDTKKKYVSSLNKIIKDEISRYKNIYINSTNKSIPQILNFSIIGVESDKFQKLLEEYEVYISTRSACTKSKDPSTSVLTVTKNPERATSSLRISLSYKTKKKEVKEFIKAFKICYDKIEWK